MVDYLIVGAGLAGIGLAHTLRSKGRSFVVIDDGSQKSSSVAGGMYNPVILKSLRRCGKLMLSWPS